MDGKLKRYYKNNFLYASHRMVLPAADEKFRRSCQRCKFFVEVVGQQETRKMCLSGVKAYRTGQKRVPDSVEILDLILLLGKEALQNMLGKGGQYQIACDQFEQRL